jgi:hypothetical protein
MDSWIADVEVERRKKPRIHKPFLAKVRGVNSLGEAFEVATVLDNLSSGGLYLRLKERVDNGARIFLMIRLSTRPVDLVPVASVAVEGVVVRNEVQSNGTYGIGIAISSRRFVD